jgi:hypothetical protein
VTSDSFWGALLKPILNRFTQSPTLPIFIILGCLLTFWGIEQWDWGLDWWGNSLYQKNPYIWHLQRLSSAFGFWVVGFLMSTILLFHPKRHWALRITGLMTLLFFYTLLFKTYQRYEDAQNRHPQPAETISIQTSPDNQYKAYLLQWELPGSRYQKMIYVETNQSQPMMSPIADSFEDSAALPLETRFDWPIPNQMVIRFPSKGKTCMRFILWKQKRASTVCL